MTEHNSLTVTVNEELTKAVGDALNPDAIRAAVLAEAEKQAAALEAEKTAQATADAEKQAAAANAPAAPEPKIYTRTEFIGGKEFNFEAESEVELERAVNNAYKVAYAFQQPEAPEPVVDEAAEKAAADKASADRAAANAELELKFKRGEISASDYLEQSGAVSDYLEKQGVPLSELKASVEQNRNSSFEKSWEQAVQEFLSSPSGADWPGGPQNLEMIGLKLASLNLTNAADKVGALASAYQAMKDTHMVFPHQPPSEGKTTAAVPTVQVDPQAAPAAAPAAVAPQPKAPTSSTLFGRSSGTTSPVTQPAKGQAVEIPANASPTEILQLWKEQQIREGKDPNAAFTEMFSGRK